MNGRPAPGVGAHREAAEQQYRRPRERAKRRRFQVDLQVGQPCQDPEPHQPAHRNSQQDPLQDPGHGSGNPDDAASATAPTPVSTPARDTAEPEGSDVRRNTPPPADGPNLSAATDPGVAAPRLGECRAHCLPHSPLGRASSPEPTSTRAHARGPDQVGHAAKSPCGHSPTSPPRTGRSGRHRRRCSASGSACGHPGKADRSLS